MTATLKAGKLTADLVPLLTPGVSVLLAVETTATFSAGDLVEYEGPGPDGEVRAFGMSWMRRRFTYIGERLPGGWIGWSGGGNPVPGRMVDFISNCGNVTAHNCTSDMLGAAWSRPGRFRLVEEPSTAEEGDWSELDAVIAETRASPEYAAEEVAAEAYQVIGALAAAAGLFDHPEVTRALDYFSGDRSGEILPFVFATPTPDRKDDLRERVMKAVLLSGDAWAITDRILALLPAPPALGEVALGTAVEVEFPEAEVGKQVLYVAGVTMSEPGMVEPEYWLSDTWPVKSRGDVSNDWKRERFTILAALQARPASGGAVDPKVVERLYEMANWLSDAGSEDGTAMLQRSVAVEHAADVVRVLAALSQPAPEGDIKAAFLWAYAKGAGTFLQDPDGLAEWQMYRSALATGGEA